MVIVDSSVWIEGLRKNGSMEIICALDGLLEAYEAQWCAPIRLEVMGGARQNERITLEKYFAIVPYRFSSEQDWMDAIQLAWKLRDHGLTAPWLDVLIATIALKDDTRIYAIDGHFEQMSRITGLRLYEPGPGGVFSPDHS